MSISQCNSCAFHPRDLRAPRSRDILCRLSHIHHASGRDSFLLGSHEGKRIYTMHTCVLAGLLRLHRVPRTASAARFGKPPFAKPACHVAVNLSMSLLLRAGNTHSSHWLLLSCSFLFCHLSRVYFSCSSRVISIYCRYPMIVTQFGSAFASSVILRTW